MTSCKLCLYATPQWQHARNDKKLVQIHVMYVYLQLFVRRYLIIVASATSRVHPHVLGVFNARCCCSVRFGPDAICQSRSRRSSRRLEQTGLEESNLDSHESPLRRSQCIALKMHLCPYRATLVVSVRGHIDPDLNLQTSATWLILPVVICLSQRLSHACLSINAFIL